MILCFPVSGFCGCSDFQMERMSRTKKNKHEIRKTGLSKLRENFFPTPTLSYNYDVIISIPNTHYITKALYLNRKHLFPLYRARRINRNTSCNERKANIDDKIMFCAFPEMFGSCMYLLNYHCFQYSSRRCVRVP